MQRTPLELEFIDDHRHMIRALKDLQAAVDAGHWKEAADLADELDRIAGPHIAFEERWLYPLVALHRGSQFSQTLEDEHGVVLDALRCLQSTRSTQWSPEKQQAMHSSLQTGLDHAVTCGTLLSHLSVLDAEHQEALLGQLQRLRTEGPRWTELHAESA